MGNDRNTWPVMVRLGLWGLPTRLAARAFFWICIVTAVGCISYGFVDPRFFVGGFIGLAALWYHLSIRWVERNDTWSQ